MRARGWVAIAAAAVGIALGLIERQVGSSALQVLTGLAYLTALGLGISMLRVWDRIGWRLPPMKRLFQRPGRDESWSVQDGRPVPMRDAPQRAAPRQRKARSARKVQSKR